jgi:hypothetical protein
MGGRLTTAAVALGSVDRAVGVEVCPAGVASGVTAITWRSTSQAESGRSLR